MPAGIKHHDLWDKAKTAAGPEQGADYWASVMARYKDLGGEASTEAEEACSSGQMGQLLRAGSTESDWRDKAPQFTSLREAALDTKKRTVRCILITEGPGNARDRNYYTPEFIADAAKKYNGARAYINHASEAEYRSRPEGDLRELCGFYRDTKVVMVRDKITGESVAAVEGTLVLDESDAGNNALAKVDAQLEYSKIFPDSAEEYCGLSISGSGVREGQADIKGQKWNRIVGVGQADSVDVVTRPARGGAFLALTESATKAQHLSKEERIMSKKLMAIVAEITETTNKLAEAKTAEARAAAKSTLDKLNKKLREAAEMDPAAVAGSQDDALIKQLIPQIADEADDVYSERLAKIKAAMAPKPAEADPDPAGDVPAAKESFKDGMSADEMRKKFPKTFEAVAARVRESVAEQGEDIKAVKAELREAKTELQILRDKQLAVKLLSEAGVPVKLLSVGDLLGMSESEMKREIERVQAMVEAAGGRVTIPAGVKGSTAAKSGKLAESIASLKQTAGV